jgi:2-hydroxymuconate-semialdehyde hydrolase
MTAATTTTATTTPAPAEIRTRRVAVGDYEFELAESGDPRNPALVLLHGSGPGATGLSNWERVLADLGHEYYCVAPDVIGFGDSTHPNPPPQGIGPFSELRVQTLIGLLGELGIEHATFVGNSMGGMWSLGIVQVAPELVDRIVLMGSGGAPIPPGPELHRLVNFYDDPTTEAMTAMMAAFVYDPESFGDRLTEISNTRTPRAVRPEVRRSHLATFDLTNPIGFSDEFLACIEQDVLIIHGREDHMVTFEAGLYFFQHIPNARLYGIGKTGHWTQIEQHEKFVGALRAFMTGAL